MSDKDIDQPIDLTDTQEQGVRPAGADSSTAKAVALEYDKQMHDVPRISATGRGAVAEQILAVAFANDVKVREDAELVDVLEMMEIDSPIPLEAFSAVAEILAYVYKANASMKQREARTVHKDSTS